jgi:hypothetical protein
MYFNLDEAKDFENLKPVLQTVEEILSFIKEKGGAAKLTNNFFTEQIALENNMFLFNLNISIPLGKGNIPQEKKEKPSPFLRGFEEAVKKTKRNKKGVPQ